MTSDNKQACPVCGSDETRVVTDVDGKVCSACRACFVSWEFQGGAVTHVFPIGSTDTCKAAQEARLVRIERKLDELLERL